MIKTFKAWIDKRKEKKQNDRLLADLHIIDEFFQLGIISKLQKIGINDHDVYDLLSNHIAITNFINVLADRGEIVLQGDQIVKYEELESQIKNHLLIRLAIETARNKQGLRIKGKNSKLVLSINSDRFGHSTIQQIEIK